MVPMILPRALAARLVAIARGDDLIVVLTGAGVSAESGIPTFRGPEGWWTVGSTNYRPEEMATRAMFQRHPDAVWQWYLYRRTLCRRAAPNAGHRALVELDRGLRERFLLITQNVDGLHLRAGSPPERTFQIHGNIDAMRCADDCSGGVYPIPAQVADKGREDPFTEADRAALTCPACGGRARPHVLWFDECYDEAHFRFESSLEAAARAALLITAGTSGATNLPMQVGRLAAGCGALIVDVNPEENLFGGLAVGSGGYFCRGASGEVLPEIVAVLGGEREDG